MRRIRQILQFSSKQCNGFMVLTALVFFMFLLPEIYFRHFFKADTFSEAELRSIEQYFRDVDSLQKEWQQSFASAAVSKPSGGYRTQSYQGDRQSYTDLKKNNRQQTHRPATDPLPAFEPFMFDPNQPDSISWLKLHLKPRQILTIKNYLSKGGKFRFKEDFRKIYGLSEEQYLKLRDFMLLPARDSTGTEH